MHVRTIGSGETPLLLLHTQVVGGLLYDRAVKLLAPDHALVVPDRIGYGQSDPAQRELTFEDYAQATVDALDALDLARVDAAGVHSGGIEAIELAVSFPERIRKVAVAALAVFTPEETKEFVDNYAKPPPEPTEDGSHLLFFWNWWMGMRPEGSSLETMQAWTLDALRAGPNFWWTFKNAIEYPMAEKLPRVTQPLLVLAPHDDLWEMTQRAIEILPPGAEVIELPHVKNPMATFETHAEEVCGHIHAFMAR
jgi:pimeloyl-ACP methyl ester carboxylesterase